MPRRVRLVVPNIPWHIIQRGKNRSACFYESSDYQYFLVTLAEQAARYGHKRNHNPCASATLYTVTCYP
jgi:putative transposase